MLTAMNAAMCSRCRMTEPCVRSFIARAFYLRRAPLAIALLINPGDEALRSLHVAQVILAERGRESLFFHIHAPHKGGKDRHQDDEERRPVRQRQAEPD